MFHDIQTFLYYIKVNRNLMVSTLVNSTGVFHMKNYYRIDSSIIDLQ